MSHANMKLGRKPAQHDPRVPHLFKHMAMQVPAPSVDWTKPVKAFGVLANNQVGDCTAAGVLHLIQIFQANNGFDYEPTDADAIALYSATSDYPKSDDGAVEHDVLTYWANTGIETPRTRDEITFASLTPSNIDQIKLSVEYFGGVYLGIALPISAQTQDVWDVPAGGLTGDGAPGSWGGHCVVAGAYDADHLTVVTWGKLLKVTWAFVQAYCDESYAVLSRDWLANSGISPPGLNYAALQTELKALQL